VIVRLGELGAGFELVFLLAQARYYLLTACGVSTLGDGAVVDGVGIEDPQGAAHTLTIRASQPAGDNPLKPIEVSIQGLTPWES
jgi:hypothetical protein